MSLTERVASLWQEDWFKAVLALGLLWLFGAWRAFKNEFSARQWALRPDRHKALKALAYAGALPFRLLFAAFAGLVEALVWGVLAAGIWMLWKAVHG